MLKTIHVDQLQPGMFIQRLHGSWLKHPFWRSSFLATAEDVERLRASAVESLEIDVALGSGVPADAASGGAEAAPAPAAEATVGSDRQATVRAVAEAPAAADLGSELSRARRICQGGIL